MVLWDVLISIFWFMLLFAWLWLLITLLGDLFHDHSLSGWAKALWTLFIIVIPWLGALTYIGVRGQSMRERARAETESRIGASRDHATRGRTGPPSTSEELAMLADLRERGAVSDEEFARAKATLLGTERPTGPPPTNKHEASGHRN